MPPDPLRVKAVFQAALDLPGPADRPAFLDRECGDDRELRARVDQLLAAHDHPATALERALAASSEAPADPGATSAPDETTDHSDPTASYRSAPASPIVGTVIAGRYKVRQEIGEGGMGSVYLAEQTQPVKRQVALKLIKAGMDSRTVLARFESERQALALMDHPNIAKVLDAGTTEQGRPFFVMELVKGLPLTEYCDQHRLALPERLNLFRQICSAVQHAHQKGIIHRDLKPSNILVESHDEKPVPKVIDFGLAKATSGLRLTENSLYSAFGSVAGTPLYMAPEQATFNAIDVDTRADIYALGVILYELLTGTTPIQRDTMKKAALDEMLRVIREVEPPTPSSRIGSSDTLPNVAASRHTEPARLSRFIRGDLDWIVMKALAKERQRRYESAIAFAHDIERFLNHEPVTAGPPSATYRLKKFVRRNRLQVTAASLVLLALVAGIAGTTLGLFEARRQATEAKRQKTIADDRRAESDKRLAQRDKANAILLSVFKDLDPKDVRQKAKPLAARLGERLDQAAAQIEGQAVADPLGVARMQAALGVSQVGLGHYDKATALFVKAHDTFKERLGPDDKETLSTLNNLGLAYYYEGKLDRAVPILKETLEAETARLGPEDGETLEVMGNLAGAYLGLGKFDQAIPLFEKALPTMTVVLGRDHPNTLAIMNTLGEAYRQNGQLDLAMPLFEETLGLRKVVLGEDHPSTLVTMNNIAIVFQSTGRLDKAVPLFEETLRLTREKLGPDHPETLQSMGNLASAYLSAGNGKQEAAVALLEKTVALMKAKLGPEHPETLVATGNLGRAYRFAGKADRSIATHEDVIARMRAKLGPEHPQVLTNLINLGNAYADARKFDKALQVQQEASRLAKARFAENHFQNLILMGNIARSYQNLGKLDEAVAQFEETVGQMRARLGADHPATLINVANLAAAYRANGQLDRAFPLYEQAYVLMKAKLGPDHPDTLSAMATLAIAEKDTGKIDQAVARFKELADLWKARDGADSPSHLGSLSMLADALLARNSWAEAETVLRGVLAVREKKEPDGWPTFNTRSMLGGALAGQEKYAEARPLLETGYQGLHRKRGEIPPQARFHLGRAIDRLIALAEATGDADAAKAWKDECATLPPEAFPKPEPKRP